MFECWIFFLAKIFAPKEVKRARSNCEKILGLSGKDVERFVRRNLSMQCILACESLLYFLGFKVILENQKEFESQLDNLIEKDRGILMVTAHLGAWEIMASQIAKLMSDHHKKMYVLAKRARYMWVTRLLNAFRKKLGVQVLWNDSKSLLKDMVSVLKSKNVLGFVMDQKPHRREGYNVTFLGHSAAFVKGPETLARKLELDVFVIFFVRVAPRSYRAEWQFLEWATYEEGILTQKIADIMSQTIHSNVDQWTWNYKRWVDERPPNS